MSTRPEPWGSGAVEIVERVKTVETATRNGIVPGSVGLAQGHPLLITKPPALRQQPSV